MDIISSPIVENFQNATNKETSNVNSEELPPETENSSANSSLNKMESLLVEEEDEDDEDNVDDGLGTESLRISGSEGEDNEDISPVRVKKRPTQQILESDEDDGESEDKVEKDVPPSSDLLNEKVDKVQEGASNPEASEKQKKFSALIDSDSEPEETNDIQEQSEGEKVKEALEVNKKKKKKKNSNEKQKKTKAKSASENSDSENDEEVSSKSGGKKKKSGISNLVDSDSESSSNADSEGEEKNEQGKTPAAPRPKKPQRASAKKAMDEMQAIQSETQRLYRETQVNIPYHKPKRHTLKEFLTRRTVVKPTLNQTGKSLKMTPEELEEYAKHLEERAKEATEFFKSESEDELKDVEENEPTEKEKETETVIPMDTSASEPKEPEVQADASRPLNTEEIDQILQEHEFISQPSTQELLDIGVSHQSEPATHPTASTSTAKEVTPTEPEPQPSTSSSSARPSALAELKRRLLAEKNIPLVPTLKGDSNMIIDFETGNMFARKPTGVETLFQRFIKSNKNNKKKPEEPTPSQELQETLKVAVIQEANKEKEPKPGAAYVKLKENLRNLISRKRKQEFQKKIEETKEEEDEYKKCCGLDDDDEEEEEEAEDEKRKSEKKLQKMQSEIVIDEEENEIALEEYGDEEEEAEEDDQPEDKNKDQGNEEEAVENEEGNEEENQENQAEDDDDADDADDNESDSSSSEEEQQQDPEDPSTRKHRVIKAFEDSDDEVNPDLNATSTSVLFAEEAQKNPEEIEDELLDLCSGQFAETQRATVISQIPITQTPGNVTETELEDLCSGVFDGETAQTEQTQTQAAPKTQKTAKRILSSDEEKEPEEETRREGKKVKKLTKKKKKHMKLGFSDDEDEDEEPNAAAEDIEEDTEEEVEEEIPQTFIDYDSEENEIEVQMSKKDCVKKATAFLEKEAELSESEWGSADEDEQNLDKYDNELGDEDEFDQQKLHTELEQIHMRKVLDDDIREVKKIQEMLFDDEEADGVGRQRKFRWKNAESGFSLDDPAGGGANDNDDQNDSADDEEEIKWRKMRFEREQFLMQKSREEIIADVSKTELGKKLLGTMDSDLDMSNFVIREEEVIVAKEYKPSFLYKLNDTSKMRNSMLNYDKEILAKMVKAIEKSGDYVSADNEQVMKRVNNAGNFVFVPLTEEQKEMRKRKAEEASKGNVAKKKKTIPHKSLFLDKLL